MRERPDFIQVRLSEAGRKFAGAAGVVRVATVHMHYLFEGDTAVEVLRRGEWTTLQRDCDAEGNLLFEAVESSGAAEAAAVEARKVL
jgi:hypothetical protein